MEGLKLRTFAFAAVMLVAGIVNYITVSRTERPDKDEKWMEQRAPEKVGDMVFFRSPENPQQSYKMDKITYEMLAPFGIVARQYTATNGKSFDVVLIASESRASFHDPRICFGGSGWRIASQSEEKVQTQTRGSVPVMLVKMENDNKRDMLAAYCYRGPSGFMASTVGVKLDMFWNRLMNRSDIEGVFYRFIPQYQGATEEDLKAFIAEYLEASKESSQGYF